MAIPRIWIAGTGWLLKKIYIESGDGVGGCLGAAVIGLVALGWMFPVLDVAAMKLNLHGGGMLCGIILVIAAGVAGIVAAHGREKPEDVDTASDSGESVPRA